METGEGRGEGRGREEAKGGEGRVGRLFSQKWRDKKKLGAYKKRKKFRNLVAVECEAKRQ